MTRASATGRVAPVERLQGIGRFVGVLREAPAPASPRERTPANFAGTVVAGRDDALGA